MVKTGEVVSTRLLVDLPRWSGGPAHDSIPHLGAQQLKTYSQETEVWGKISVFDFTGGMGMTWHLLLFHITNSLSLSLMRLLMQQAVTQDTAIDGNHIKRRRKQLRTSKRLTSTG
jgi:hypothetical protein